MKQTKRITALLLAAMLTLAFLPLGASAQDPLPAGIRDLIPTDLNREDLKPLGSGVSSEVPVITGTCGDNLTWTYHNTYLTISGTGDMYDYSPENPAPWNDEYGSIYTITLEDGVTSIGSYAFTDLFRLMEVYIPYSVTRIGSSVLDGAAGSSEVCFLGDAPSFQPDSLTGFNGKAVYICPWPDDALQNYGGSPRWQQAQLQVSSTSKQLYALNEPIEAQDLEFLAVINDNSTFLHTPREVIIGEYDNSTYGEKTVQLTADGQILTHTYYVTDGSNHLDTLTVEYDSIYYYTGARIYPQPIVKTREAVLENGVHYSIQHDNSLELGDGNSFTIIGKGIYSGYEKTFPYTIVKQDIASAVDSVYVENAEFYGMPVAPEVKVYWNLKEGEDYLVIYEDNVNIGTGTARIVGIGGYTGAITETFQIDKKDTTLYLDGVLSGNAAQGEYNDDYYYQEGILSPGVLTARIDVGYYHAAYYALYHIVGEDAELVTEYEPEPGTAGKTLFTYDFTDVYHSDNPEGGETYMLVYQWMNDDYAIFSGVCVMFVPSKVPEATSMVMGQVLEDGDFRREYLTVAGEDGIVRDVTWTSSDESILTVDKGDVSILKPGVASVTAQTGDLFVCYEIEVPALKLSDGIIFNYEAEDGVANVIYEDQLLEAGTDYTLSVKTADAVTEVWAEGKGLFSGLVMRQLDANGEPIGHTHTFDFACDDTCGTCDFTRETGHQYGDTWTKDMDGHWHACSVCGEKADYAEHILNDAGECTVCGPLYTPGDLDGSLTVNEDDAIYLLQHVLLPDFFPVYQSVDYDHNGQINEDDAIYLLQHVLLPEFFPLG